MDAAEWLESAEEANKRTVVDRSTYSRPSGRRTGQEHRRNGGKGKNGGDNNGKNGGSPDRKKGKECNPRCPESEGTGSKWPSPRSQPTDPGYVYIIEMAGSDAGIHPPPLEINCWSDYYDYNVIERALPKRFFFFFVKGNVYGNQKIM